MQLDGVEGYGEGFPQCLFFTPLVVCLEGFCRFEMYNHGLATSINHIIYSGVNLSSSVHILFVLKNVLKIVNPLLRCLYSLLWSS